MTRVLALALVVATPALAFAAEITVLCPRGMQHVVAAAAEDFQRTTKHNVWLSYGTTGDILRRAAAEELDVVINSEAGVAELEAKAAVRPGTRAVLGRVGIGIAVKAGTTPPDVATVAALRRAILKTTSLGYADPEKGGQAGRHFAKVLESIGIAPLVRMKTTLFPDGLRALESVAKGDTAMSVAPITEIRGAAGVALAGPLPDALQQVLVYAGGVMTRSPSPDVAQTFLDYLRLPAVRAQFEAGGVEVDK